MSETLKYDKRGVSANKSEVHSAIKGMYKGLYPNAFCKILPDIVARDPDYCNIMHADTAGTKTSLAYIYWKETGDLSVWKGVVQDSIVMNLDDMACVGCIDDIIISSTIGRNKKQISAEVLKEVIQGTEIFLARMEKYGVKVTLAGGETADVGDIVRTIDIGFTAFGRMKKEDVIDIKIKDGDVIVGFASYGQATYEDEYNGGMGSNGLTSARHDVFHKAYMDKYPESYDPYVPKELIFCGNKAVDDKIEIDGYGVSTVGKLVLSPTRTYLPLLKKIIKTYKHSINGIIHCTGGAQTKVGKFVKDKKVIKDNLFPIPPLFQMIEKQSGTSRKEMYQVFNMGHRLEIYTDKKTAEDLIEISKLMNIDARIIGRVKRHEGVEIAITDDKGIYHYRS
ncbi:MAG: AIR synthase related protein [Saprospiraceae bacterium]